jgi:hypothetical protein
LWPWKTLRDTEQMLNTVFYTGSLLLLARADEVIEQLVNAS